jgi:hypothetical protein
MVITTLEMEIALAKHFNQRTNLIVPNLFWSFFKHEVDLFILTPAGYGHEVEIKISRSDLKKDREKAHGHYDLKIKSLWFAVPENLEKDIDLIPDRAGIIIARPWIDNSGDARISCDRVRYPKQNGKYRFSEKQRQQITRLAALRIWTLKRQLNRMRKK